MLDALRDKTGSWVAKIFIGLLAASFAVWGVSDVFRTTPQDTVAEVGSRTISVQEFGRAFDRQLQQLSQQLGQSLTADQGRQLGLDRQVLGQLLRDAALEAQADTLNLRMSDKSVAQRIADNPQFQSSDGSFNADQFRRLLRNNGLSEQAFVVSEKQGLIRAAISDTIERGVDVPRGMIELALRFRNEQRDARYFTVTVPEQSISEPSDGEVKTYYDGNQRAFEVPERRVIAALQVTPEILSDRIEVSYEDVKAYYEERMADFSTPEKRTLQQIAFDSMAEAEVALATIKAGTSFMDTAKAKGLSEADVNLGTFTRKTLPDPSLADAAFSLDKDAVSDAVQGKLSVVLLRVVEIEAGTRQSLGEASEPIEQSLRVDRARDEVLAIYDKVEEARASGQSFDDIARDLSLTVTNTPPVDRTGQTAEGTPVADLADATAVVRAAFESDAGIDNDPVTTSGDGYVWFEVRDVRPSSIKPLDQVREQAVAGWKARQLRIAVLDKAEELKKRADAGEKLKALAGELNAEIKTLTGLKRNESNQSLDAAAVHALFAVREDGFAVSADGDGKGAKLMKSSPVFSEGFNPGSAEAKAIAKELSTFLTNDLYAQYLADLQRNLGVEIDEQVLSNAGTGAYPRGY